MFLKKIIHKNKIIKKIQKIYLALKNANNRKTKSQIAPALPAISREASKSERMIQLKNKALLKIRVDK